MGKSINVEVDKDKALEIIRNTVTSTTDTAVIDAIMHLVTLADSYAAIMFRTCVGMSLPVPDYKEETAVYLKEGHVSKYRWNTEKSKEQGYIDKNGLIPGKVISYNPFNDSYKVNFKFINSDDKEDTMLEEVSKYAIDSVIETLLPEDIF